jgi:hypothetical protein
MLAEEPGRPGVLAEEVATQQVSNTTQRFRIAERP